MEAEEAVRRAGRGALLSHETAARAHGVELVEPGRDTLTVPRNRSRLKLAGWRVFRADVTPSEQVLVQGVLVTSVLRTLIDLARVLPLGEAVAAADSALRLGLIGYDELQSGLRSAWGRGATGLRRVGALVDAASGSVLESLLRVVLVQAGLAPLSQFVIAERGLFVARVDFCWPAQRLVVEADGFAFHADRVAYRRDRERLNQLERLGWRVLRFTWEDVRNRPEHVVALVRECLEWPAA